MSPSRSSAGWVPIPTIVRSDAGRPSVVAAIGDGGRPHLAWNGHLDVVPAGSPDTWTLGSLGGSDPRRSPRGAWFGRHERADRSGARGGGGPRAVGSRTPRHPRVPPRRGRGAGRHPRDQGAVGARPARSGRVHRGRAQRTPAGPGPARRRLVHRDRVREGRPRLAAASRRQRDHVDGPVPAPPARGAPRSAIIRSPAVLRSMPR